MLPKRQTKITSCPPLLFNTNDWCQKHQCVLPCCNILSRVTIPEPITDAGFGQYKIRDCGVCFDFAAQLADEHPEILRVTLVGRSPDARENLVVGDDAPGVPHENGQHVILPWGQAQGNAMARHRALHQVNLETIDFDAPDLFAPALGMAQGGTQSG